MLLVVLTTTTARLCRMTTRYVGKPQAHCKRMRAGYSHWLLQVAPTLQQSSSAPTGGLLAGLRIGVPAEFAIAELSDEAVTMWDDGVRWLRSEGAFCFRVVCSSRADKSFCGR